MNLSKLKAILNEKGCKNIYVKRLSPNDNSKNQVYLGGSFDILNIFPISEIICEPKGNWEKDRFKASISFYWVNEEGCFDHAPFAQFILYPKYPEVRFSGFLKYCSHAPSELMRSRIPGRILFLSVSPSRDIFGFIVDADSELAREFSNLSGLAAHGIFSIIEISDHRNNRDKLLSEMLRIHNAGWIDSKRLDRHGEILPCTASQCGGYTLEAELGITPNGFSEPDFMGWEIKQFHANNLNSRGNGIVTLMTPEPTNGFYVESGVEAFIRRYGYVDRKGREDRLNFGGIYKAGIENSLTHLRLELIGFDVESSKIRSVEGRIALIDNSDREAASWSFSSLLKHWNRKHNLACYVPSQSHKEPSLQYRYGNILILGNGTDFTLFLKQMGNGNVYYDPGIKMENASSHPHIKRRSQFRTKSRFLDDLYYTSETIDLHSL